MSLSWWPYPITPKEAVKKGIYIVTGTIVGAYIINYFFKPMKDLTDDYENGKILLLNKYLRIFEERKIRELLDESAIYSHKMYFQKEKPT